MKVVWLGVVSLLALLTAVSAQEPPRPEEKLAGYGASLVLVEIQLSQREDLYRSQEQTSSLSGEERKREQLRKQKTPLVYPGVVVGKREVLFSDPRIDPDDYGSVQIRTRDERKLPARLGGLLKHAPGVLVLIEGDEDLPPAVRFSAMESLDFASVRALWLERTLDRIVLRTSLARLDGLMADGGVLKRNPFRRGALILDEEQQAVGVSLGDYLYAKTNDGRMHTTFLGLELLRTPGMPQEDLVAAYSRVRTRLGRALVRVKIEYQLPAKDEGGGVFASSSSNGALPDDTAYGILVGDGRLFFPLDPGYEKVRRISRIVALVGEGSAVREIEGEFVGSIKSYQGLLLEFPEIPGSRAAELAEGDPPGRFAHCVQVTPERRFGKDRVRLRNARVLGESVVEERGEERRRPRLDVEIKPGVIFSDLEGRILGIVTREKEEGEETGGGLPGYYQPAGTTQTPRVYWSAELAAEWTDPEEHFDPRAVPRSRLHARRLVWLGVEFQYFSKALAREIRVQDATRDGERGLLVNMVYPGSPAEKAGLRAGDILLYLLEEGRPDSEKRELLRPGYYQWRSEMSSYGGHRIAPRSNELTRLLTGIGEGRKVKLVWLREGEEKSLNTVLEEAPPDFESAEKWKDERLGMTVKDLTYEVRAFHRLSDDFEGVIVALVESGSPAEVAEVQVMTILQTVNGQPIPDVAAYRSLVGKVLEEEGTSLTFFMKFLGGGRFVEVRPLSEEEDEGDD